VAINEYGESEASPAGNGAVIITYPDAPVDFSEDLTYRTSSSIGLKWNPGAHDGGSTVLNYILSYKEQSESEYTIYVDNIGQQSWTVEGLSKYKTYDFKVQA
jgi:hypothetical protein